MKFEVHLLCVVSCALLVLSACESDFSGPERDALAAAQSELNFSSVPADTCPITSSAALQVQNLGPSVVSLLSAETEPGAFRTISFDRGPIPPGGSGQVFLSFKPSAAGSYQSEVTVVSDQGQRLTATLRGQGITLTAGSAWPSSLDFGAVVVDRVQELVLYVGRDAETPQQRRSVTVMSGNPFFQTVELNSPSECTFRAIGAYFYPRSLGDYTGEIFVAPGVSQAETSIVVPLRGQGQ